MRKYQVFVYIYSYIMYIFSVLHKNIRISGIHAVIFYSYINALVIIAYFFR